MGNLIWQSDGWYIDGNDKVKVGEVIEIKQPDDSWTKVTVGQDAMKVFHPEPAGTVFNTGMQVRRIQKS